MTDRGTYRRYEPEKRLSPDTLKIIDYCNHIIGEYESKGFIMSVRQVYYQAVARGYTGGENSGKMYDRIQGALNTGRWQGLVSWTALEDRERNLMGLQHYDSPAEVLRSARASYRRDLWAEQQWRPEVWVEKKALEGVVGHICNRLRVDFFACKGYNSQSEQWRAGRRFASYIQKGQRPIVFHLGDHDPSGIDMTRDNRDRLSIFAGTPIVLQRLALNMPQIEELNPPPNPAKMSDSRAADYVEQYGEESWELDALDPEYISNLVENAIMKIRDPERWNDALQKENDDLARLNLVLEEFGSNTEEDDDDED
jgi:hypothetical protein